MLGELYRPQNDAPINDGWKVEVSPKLVLNQLNCYNLANDYGIATGAKNDLQGQEVLEGLGEGPQDGGDLVGWGLLSF